MKTFSDFVVENKEIIQAGQDDSVKARKATKEKACKAYDKAKGGKPDAGDLPTAGEDENQHVTK